MNVDKLQRCTLVLATSLVLAACGATTPVAPPPAPTAPTTPPIEATDEAVEEAYNQLRRSAREIADYWAERSFEEFEASVYREPDGGKYIVSGDTPIIDIKHLREFFEQNILVPRVTSIVVNQAGGLDTVWTDAQKRALTYCVSTGFGQRYSEVVAAMDSAAGAWEAAADVNFIHLTENDSNCDARNNLVLFDINPVFSGAYLARAFFPNDPRSERNVLIDSSSFSLGSGNLTLAGILRHELGHTLGFRHEHTRPEAGTCFEDANWRPLTDYDAFSTMHYPQCNGRGDWSLALTDADKSGAACLYGAAPGFTIDTAICQPEVAPADPCGERTVTRTGSVAQGQEVSFEPFPVTPGSALTVNMTGTGDPDLYVRFRFSASVSNYDCRPYLSGPTETCDLTTPAGAEQAFVMVRGYRPGTFELQVTHTPGQ